MIATTTSPLTSFRLIAADIKIAHSIFALPFALLAAFLAAPGNRPGEAGIDWSHFGGQLVLIVLAMVCARTVAMLANRLLDREIDRHSPRTAGRALPSGKLSPRMALVALLLSTILFMLVCSAFGYKYDNWWPAILGLPVLGWISVYPLLKRFTALCHLYLGSSLALSPLAAALAIQPESVMQQPALWLLAGMVMCWVAGFDIIYALQDLETDIKQGLHSIPRRFGISGGMWISRLLHMIAAACLFAAWWIDDRFGLTFLMGVCCIAGLLIFEHATVSRWGTKKNALAFFTVNGIISCGLGALGIIDILL
ncbi:MAG: 4-hydroxybenzoate octaprenyltransferase [Planctomycetes bacterium]|nr:4-hydroxybenzoate octaprenyltransferase [Planctomycetota bacterium]